MADSKARFESATRKWEQLCADDAYSRPPSEGVVAILASYYTDPGLEFEQEIFRAEALALAGRFREVGRRAVVGLDVGFSDITRVLQDPTISDVHLIGHGTLSTFDVRVSGPAAPYYTWEHVSTDANHLKQGLFVQRMCGVIRCDFSPPLGLFAVSRHCQVYAAVGEHFEPESIDDEVNLRLRPLILEGQMSYRYVRNSFIKQDPSATERVPIVRVPAYTAD